MNAITYSRVSTADQAEHGTSLTSQAEACRKFAEGRGWQVVGEYQDDASGVTPLASRPGLLDAYMVCADDGVGVLVVLDVDRLARSTWVGSSIQHEFAELGVTLYFVQGGDTTEPTDTLMVDIKQAFAAHERLKILERTRRGKLTAARAGRVITRVPFGYRSTDRRVVVDEAEADVVRSIFRAYAEEGLSLNGVARWLAGQGIPAPRGGERWGRPSLRRILLDSAYRGEWQYNKRKRTLVPGGKGKGKGTYRMVDRPRQDWVPMAVPPIVDAGLWQRAQDRLAENRVSRRRPTRVQTPLGGLVFCAACGARMARQYRVDYQYWRCNRRKDCGAPSFPGKELELAVADWVVGLARSRAEFDAALAGVGARPEPMLRRLRAAEATTTRLQGSIQRASELYVAGTWDRAHYDVKVRDLGKRLAEAQADAARVRADLGGSAALDPDAALGEWDAVFDELRRLVPRLGQLDPRVDAGLRDALAGIYRRLNLQVTLGTKGKRQAKVVTATCRLGTVSLLFTTSL